MFTGSHVPYNCSLSNSRKTVTPCHGLISRHHSCQYSFVRLVAAEVARAGIGLRWNASSVKALQQAPSTGGALYHSADVENNVAGYDVILSTFNDNYSCITPDGTRRPHPYTDVSFGMFPGPDGPHKTKHTDECRRKDAGLSGRLEIAGLSPNPHEQCHMNSVTFCSWGSRLHHAISRQPDRPESCRLHSPVWSDSCGPSGHIGTSYAGRRRKHENDAPHP